MPGEYQGTVYVPAAPGGITLYGTGEKPIDVKIGLSLDGGMSLPTGVTTSTRAANICQVNQRVYVR